ncbi:cytochrome ubiquinol oxidase subunit I [Paenibacillus paridis]|uniref:cytochrome ubiquinol oxidase subunit I n=1 Tax=Paenibacillus paridis TaxID=2583376 RepID=UPI00111F5CD0|nr:cytochrome ubiquinol oxidase subunit I [Paenibacillus paridis]
MLLTGYDPVMFSRILTSLTLGFHIIYATIGVGVPLMIALAEWIGIRRNDFHYLLLARRWARGFVITVAVGVVTGTAIGLQLSLLWPSFMQVAGQSISLPLFLETFAFFFEAIFLGIYLYTWDRFKSRMTHFWLLIPVVIGSSASAFFITIVNAFMNYPVGFTLKAGEISEVNPIAAMLSPAMPTKVAHVLSSAYLTCAFVLAAITAWSLLKGKNHVYYKKALKLTMVCAFVFMVSTALIGDLSGKYLAKYQPEKLAATEWHFETMGKAPLVLGGVLTEDNQVRFGLEIPFGLSILAHSNPFAEVIGLNDFPEDERPPLWIHYLFDIKMGYVAFMVFVSLLFLVEMIRKKGNTYRRWLLRAIVVAAPVAILTIEHGWIFSEVGRQPWILRGIMRTSEGATTSGHVDLMLWLFALLYLVLGVSSARVLVKMFRNNQAEDELAKYDKEARDLL